MNKTILSYVITLLVGVFLGVTGYNFYQSQPKNSTVNKHATPTSAQDQKAIKCKTNEIARVHNGKVLWGSTSNVSEVDQVNAVLSDGTVVKSNGEIIKKDGTKIILKDGETYYVELPGPCPTNAMPPYQGKVDSINNSSSINISGGRYGGTVNVDSDTKIFDEDNMLITFADINEGFVVEVTQSSEMSKMGDGAITASKIKVISR